MTSAVLKLSSRPSQPLAFRSGSKKPISPLMLYWLAFIGSVACFVVGNALPIWPAPFAMALSVASAVTCGLAWLLARALFRPSEGWVVWPIGLVVLLFVCTLVLRFVAAPDGHPVLAYIGDLQTLLGSAMLVLIALEALNAKGRTRQDSHLRRTFLISYISILAVAVGAGLPELARWETPIQLTLSVIAAFGATAAVRFRFARTGAGQTVTAPHSALADRLTRLLEESKLYRQPGLKVSDLARHLNEPDYRISQAIVQTMGYANFNQWINGYRIAEAMARLSGPDANHLSILNLSIDCGFNSLGPFNRAFKAETGLTPSQFRRHHQANALQE